MFQEGFVGIFLVLKASRLFLYSFFFFPALFSSKKKRVKRSFLAEIQLFKRGQELKNQFCVCCNVAVWISWEIHGQWVQVLRIFFPYLQSLKSLNLPWW